MKGAKYQNQIKDVIAVNIHGTQRLIEAMCQAQIPYFLFVSSRSVYGSNVPFLTPETQLP